MSLNGQTMIFIMRMQEKVEIEELESMNRATLAR